MTSRECLARVDVIPLSSQVASDGRNYGGDLSASARAANTAARIIIAEQPAPVPSWFSSIARITALEREAMDWEGTPFFPNGNTKHVGVSCQKLAAAIYGAVGFCYLETPNVQMSRGRFAQDTKGILIPWIEARPEFARITCSPFPGDLLVFNMGQIGHHCGIYLERKGERFIHAMHKIGTTICCLTDATWKSRLIGTWRPLP